MRLPVISLWQPWAQWVVYGWKTIETRTHWHLSSLAGERIAIHAAKKWDNQAVNLAREYMTDREREGTEKFTHHGGEIIGTAFVVEHRALNGRDSIKAMIDCNPQLVQRFGLVLRAPIAVEPIPCKGRQGIWYYDIHPLTVAGYWCVSKDGDVGDEMWMDNDTGIVYTREQAMEIVKRKTIAITV